MNFPMNGFFQSGSFPRWRCRRPRAPFCPAKEAGHFWALLGRREAEGTPFFWCRFNRFHYIMIFWHNYGLMILWFHDMLTKYQLCHCHTVMMALTSGCWDLSCILTFQRFAVTGSLKLVISEPGPGGWWASEVAAKFFFRHVAIGKSPEIGAPSILMGFFIINRPFWGIPLMEPPIYLTDSLPFF